MNLSNIHPLMASVLQSVVDAGVISAQLQRVAYIERLKAHDWWYEYSDDGNVYEAGRDSFKELRMLRHDLDPDGALWNQFAPSEYQLKAVAS